MSVVDTMDVSVLETDIQPSKEKVLRIIDEYYEKSSHSLLRFTSSDLNRNHKVGVINWQNDIGDEADLIFDKVRENEENIRKKPITLAHDGDEHKTNPQSIVWEVLDVLSWAEPLPDDLPHLRKFLLTPAGKELEGWEEWEAYWNSRHTDKT